MITMIRDPKAYAKSQAKKQTAFENKVAIAFIHLPRVLSEKHDGLLQASRREDVRDMLVADGVLGARRNAKRIAHAKKHNLWLNQWQKQEADMIVDTAIERAVDAGIIKFTSNGQAFGIQLLVEIESDALEIAEFEKDFDPDEEYPLWEHLPQHLRSKWRLTAAHE
jgi:hypothetical protein